MGIGGACAITPVNSTRIAIAISGILDNNTGGNGAFANIRYGTGTAPSNGAAATGTTATKTVQVTQLLAGQNAIYSQVAVVTGLMIGTNYWIDLALGIVVGGTARIRNLNVMAYEV